jgi:UDP-glucose 4-epimerase
LHFVVTGGAGFIGSNLANYLIEKHHSVRIVDNLQSGKLENIKDKSNFNNLDILDYEKLKNILKQADGIFHLAALSNTSGSFERPEEYHKVNVLGTENVFKLANKFGIKVVFSSSAAIYGNTIKIPIKENCNKNPLNPYAVSKMMAENMAIKYAALGTSIIGLRYFNVYGKSNFEFRKDVISRFIKKISLRCAPVIYGDGTQTRDFVHVEDVAHANLIAMQSDVDKEFFNIGSGTSISILELAKQMIRAANLSLEPIMVKAPNPEIKYSKADIELANNLLRWRPKKNLIDWINQTVLND